MPAVWQWPWTSYRHFDHLGSDHQPAWMDDIKRVLNSFSMFSHICGEKTAEHGTTRSLVKHGSGWVKSPDPGAWECRQVVKSSRTAPLFVHNKIAGIAGILHDKFWSIQFEAVQPRFDDRKHWISCHGFSSEISLFGETGAESTGRVLENRT